MADTTTIEPLINKEAMLPTNNDQAHHRPSDDEGNKGSEKRRKLYLWKCEQCRNARKKCFPADRIWPQKCERCLQHRPEALDCSEPQVNTRKQGDNSSNSARRPKRASEYNKPLRTTLERIKREQAIDLFSEVPFLTTDDQYPTSAYLSLPEGQFRILRLAPGCKDDEEVVCSFLTASMSQRLDYEAVSCIWGASDATKQKSSEIKLHGPQENCHSIFTSNNVYAALRSLRHPKDERLLWLDALCIDHSNSDEKNRQVAMKSSIFRNADNLYFWLDEDANSKAALTFIPRILDLDGIDKLVREDQAIDGWASFVGLLKNTVFSRLWLIQEVASARNVTLHCCQTAIHYHDFVDAVAIFVSCRANIAILFRRNQETIAILSDQKVTMAERFIDVSTNSLRFTPTDRIQRLLTMEDLVSKLSLFRSANHLDRVFTILALAKDGPLLMEDKLIEFSQQQAGAFEIEIDYTRSVLEVYQNFVRHAIGRSLSLDIICRHWASSVSEQESSLPTWVRSLQSCLQSPFDSNISERIDVDYLVGIPNRNYYNASKGTVANYRIVPLLSDPKRSSLNTRGIRIDEIFKLGSQTSEGILLYEWLELGGCNTVDEIVPEDCWKTLVAGRGPNGSKIPSWYKRAFLYCLHHFTPGGDMDMNQLIAKEAASSSFIISFLQRVQAVIWNRKFLVSKYNSWIGLAPMAAVVDDIICILYGCSVPVVLRLQKDERGEFFYNLVGECYVHGMMDGDALKTAKASGYFEEVFEIR